MIHQWSMYRWILSTGNIWATIFHHLAIVSTCHSRWVGQFSWAMYHGDIWATPIASIADVSVYRSAGGILSAGDIWAGVLEERSDRDRESDLRASSCRQMYHGWRGCDEWERTLLWMFNWRHRSAGCQVLRAKTMSSSHSGRRPRAHRTLSPPP